MRAAAKAALDETVLGYTVALGIPELRVAIAESYQDRRGLTVDPADVVVTTGSSGGFLLAFLASFDAGDRVRSRARGIPVTAISCRRWAVRSWRSLRSETRFQPTTEMLAALDPPVQGVSSRARPTRRER